MKKAIVVLLTLAMLLSLVSCSSFLEGFQDGFQDGYSSTVYPVTNDNFIEFVESVFNQYYTEYDFYKIDTSAEEARLIINNEWRTKVEGLCYFSLEQWANGPYCDFIIVVEWTDESHTDYKVVTFQIDDTDVLTEGIVTAE